MNEFSGINDSEKDPFGEEALMIDLGELRSWILYEDEDMLVINKPGWVVCHPSKNGPLSSLVGACREYTGLDCLHLVSRLDRETSGLVILAKNRARARICQMALEARMVKKNYYVLLCGELGEEVEVDQPIAKDIGSVIHAKQCVREDRTAQSARTTFRPICVNRGFSFCEVELHTGRKHQIRAHAEWLGYPVVGDKMYGPDETLFLEFIEKGWTERLEAMLPMKRQAIHAARLEFMSEVYKSVFMAPLPRDMVVFGQNFMNFDLQRIVDLKNPVLIV